MTTPEGPSTLRGIDDLDLSGRDGARADAGHRPLRPAERVAP